MPAYRFLLAFCLLAGCGERIEQRPPGAYDAPLAGHIEVRTVDRSGVPRDVDLVRIELASGENIERAGPASRFVIDDPRLEGSVNVTAATTTWVGVDASLVVMDVELPREETITVRVGSLEPSVVDVRLSAFRTASLFDGDLLSELSAAPSTLDGEDLLAPLEQTSDSDELAAIAVDDTGTVATISVAALQGETLDASATSVSTTTIEAAFPAAPIGFTAVVGVPGIALGEDVALLPQDPSTFVVPAREGALADATFWVIAESRPLDDASARTVVLQRSLSTSIGQWPAFLEVPSVPLVSSGRLTIARVPSATVHAIEWLDGAGVVLARTWAFGSASIDVAALAAAASVRIRALDATIGPSGFDIASATSSVARFSERTFSLP